MKPINNEDTSKCVITANGQIKKPINNEDILKRLLPENGQNILLEDIKTGETFELTPEEFINEFGLDELYEGSPLDYLSTFNQHNNQIKINMPTFTNFWEWLVNSGAITIPTLGTQNGNQEIEIINLPANQNPETGFFTIHVDLDGVCQIRIPSGNKHRFSQEIAQRTWDRFLGLLSTTARANGYHHLGVHIPAPLPQIFTHQMASAYTLPPKKVGNANLHQWFDCPNKFTCVFIAATIRVFLLTNLPAGHILYPYV